MLRQEIFSTLKNKYIAWKSEIENEWRRSKQELAADAYGYRLYLEFKAGKLTPEELKEKIENSSEEFGYDLVHVRYGAEYAKDHPPVKSNPS